MESEMETMLQDNNKMQSTTSRIKAWFVELLREQTDLIRTTKDSAERTLEEVLRTGKYAEQAWKVAQAHDEGQKILRRGGWTLFKRVVGTILKDGEDLIK